MNFASELAKMLPTCGRGWHIGGDRLIKDLRYSSGDYLDFCAGVHEWFVDAP